MKNEVVKITTPLPGPLPAGRGEGENGGDGGGGSAPDRVLKATFTEGEWGVIMWAQNHAGTPGPAGFARRAMFAAVRRVISDVAWGRGKIPPGVAKDFETWKGNL